MCGGRRPRPRVVPFVLYPSDTPVTSFAVSTLAPRLVRRRSVKRRYCGRTAEMTDLLVRLSVGINVISFLRAMGAIVGLLVTDRRLAVKRQTRTARVTGSSAPGSCK